jgi:uracil-DNA glycosylase
MLIILLQRTGDIHLMCPDKLPDNVPAKTSGSMLLVGEAWGENEESLRLPFVGESGKELWRMLGEAMPDVWPEEHARVSALHKYGLAWVRERQPWLDAAGIKFSNVLNARPPDNKLLSWCGTKKEVEEDDPSYSYNWPPISKGKYLRPVYLPEVRRLFEEIRCQRPNLVVALGNTACWALLRTTNISSIRGAITSATEDETWKILPTYHPAGVLYQWSWRPIVVADLIKARRESQFPEIRRPRRQILVSPTLLEVRTWIEATLTSNPRWVACDTETSGGLIDTLGFSTSESNAIVIPFGPHRYKIGNNFHCITPVRDGTLASSYWQLEEERQVWRLIFSVLESPIPKLFQNGLYDLQYILKLGVHPQNCLEDSMLIHHALYPELQKGLGFLGSIYTDEASWKLMRRHRAGDSEKRDE